LSCEGGEVEEDGDCEDGLTMMLSPKLGWVNDFLLTKITHATFFGVN